MPQETALGGVGILPPALDELLRGMAVVNRRSLIVRGFSEDCAKADDVTGTTQHPFADWITGVYRRHVLLLRMCIACETVEVRDRTRSMEAVVGATLRDTPDTLLGWYTGARPRQRVYH
jgi:hypothetical protein